MRVMVRQLAEGATVTNTLFRAFTGSTGQVFYPHQLGRWNSASSAFHFLIINHHLIKSINPVKSASTYPAPASCGYTGRFLRALTRRDYNIY